VFGERVSRPAVPVRVPHDDSGLAAQLLHVICRHRPASRAEAAVSRTWLPVEASRELRSDGAARPAQGMRALSSGSKGMPDYESQLNGARGRAQPDSLGPRGDR
jgi:hypothetical protein